MITLTEEKFKEFIEAAHRAGQHNQGHCDPSVYEAMAYYETEVRPAVNEPEKDVSNNEMAVCDIDFEGCKDTSYFPNCGDCVYLSKGKQTEC